MSIRGDVYCWPIHTMRHLRSAPFKKKLCPKSYHTAKTSRPESNIKPWLRDICTLCFYGSPDVCSFQSGLFTSDLFCFSICYFYCWNTNQISTPGKCCDFFLITINKGNDENNAFRWVDIQNSSFSSKA